MYLAICVSAQREVLTGLMDSVYANLTRQLAEARSQSEGDKKSPADAEALLDEAPFDAAAFAKVPPETSRFTTEEFDAPLNAPDAPDAEEVYLTAEEVYLTAEDVYLTAEEVYLTAAEVYLTLKRCLVNAEEVYLTAEDVYLTLK
eukprot:1667103-Pyramimonas_sp.AAC.1